MNAKGFIKNLLTRACIYFSVIMLFYIVIAAVVNVTDSDIFLEAGRTVLFFVFSLLLGCANAIFSIKSVSGGLRLIIHYVIVLFGFYTCFLLPIDVKPSGLFIGIVIFSALYFAYMGISAAFRSRYRANAEKTDNYVIQYSKQKK